MPKETKTRVTAAQTDVLCIFFEENPEVIKGYKKTPECVEAVQTKWKQITIQLNSLGPARDHKAWAKYLCDIKAKLKRKRIKWRQNSDGTGPIMCNADDFNEIKFRMLQVLRKDVLNSQESQDSNASDIDLDDSIEDDHEKKTNDEMAIFPLKGSKNKSKLISNISHTKLSPNEATPSDPQTPQFFMNHNECNDEFDTFGKNIAQQLRALPLSVALETQEMLLSVIRKQRLKVLNDCNVNMNPLERH